MFFRKKAGGGDILGTVVVGITERSNPHVWRAINARAEQLCVGEVGFEMVVHSFDRLEIPVIDEEECGSKVSEYEAAPNPLSVAESTANETVIRSNANISVQCALNAITEGEIESILALHRFACWLIM